MIVAWSKHAGSGFTRAVLRMCALLGWPSDFASWVMACIAFESGESFSASVRNQAGSSAVGLIQFMPATARGLGTTTEDLEDMSPVAQLVYVQRYFEPYKGRIRSLADMYMAILMPRYIGAAGDAVIFTDGTAYRQNAGLDANTDGKITVDEAVDRVRQKLARGWQPQFGGFL
jgi:hypothetical protein